MDIRERPAADQSAETAEQEHKHRCAHRALQQMQQELRHGETRSRPVPDFQVPVRPVGRPQALMPLDTGRQLLPLSSVRVEAAGHVTELAVGAPVLQAKQLAGKRGFQATRSTASGCHNDRFLP